MEHQQLEILLSTEAQNQEIHRRLQAYNRQFMRDVRKYHFHIEAEGRIIAGIVAASTFDTLEVESLFVEQAYRGKGLGKKLLLQAEQAAARDGIHHVLLNTYSFQALQFYATLGYTQLFAIDPCLGTHSQHFFWKDLF